MGKLTTFEKALEISGAIGDEDITFRESSMGRDIFWKRMSLMTNISKAHWAKYVVKINEGTHFLGPARHGPELRRNPDCVGIYTKR